MDMDQLTLANQFARVGARVKLTERRPSRPSLFWPNNDRTIAIDIQRDPKGEFFDIAVRRGAAIEADVVDARPEDRHLLLLVREGKEKHKFLCGHDERHWFVAAVPEAKPWVRTVRTAMEALKPDAVRTAQELKAVKAEDRHRRKNGAYVRQGEWFFVPKPDLKVDELLVFRNEPLSRGTRSKPHFAEFCYRHGEETVYVSRRANRPLLEYEYRNLIQEKPEAKSWGWRVMRQNPEVYVKGRVSHADHKTIVLPCWHRVLMNTENQSKAMRSVTFLD